MIDLLKVAEAARLLRFSRLQVYNLVRKGTIPSVRVGGSIRIPRDRLLAWIDAHTTGGAD